MTSTPEWLRDDEAHCWHPYTQHGLDQHLLPVESAQGAWLQLTDGRRLLDAISSWWSVLHGHAEVALVQAAQQQIAQLDHVLFAGCSHEPAARLAAELVEELQVLASPKRSLQRVFYSDNGSTAIEVALKASYQSHLRRGQAQRRVFIALEGAYHGDTFGAMAVGDPVPFFQEFGPLLFEVERIAPDAEALKQACAKHGEQLAAVILEPMLQGAAGMVTHSAAFVREVREQCDQYGAHMIADEVMTGFGRTGRLFACEHAGVCPDLIALAKGLTGGIMPLSATVATEAIFESFLHDSRAKAFFHGHTFTAHPVGCAVGRASLQLCRERDVAKQFETLGQQLEASFHIASNEMALSIGQAPESLYATRRLGGMFAIELHGEQHGYLAGWGDALRSACRQQQHVLLRPLGNVLYALPPACTSSDEARTIARALAETVHSALAIPQQAR